MRRIGVLDALRAVNRVFACLRDTKFGWVRKHTSKYTVITKKKKTTNKRRDPRPTQPMNDVILYTFKE